MDTEPNYKDLTNELAAHLVTTLENMKVTGSGLFQYKGVIKHWKEHFADSLDKVPGVKIDREIMHAYSLPEKQRKKRFKEINDERAKKDLEVTVGGFITAGGQCGQTTIPKDINL